MYRVNILLLSAGPRNTAVKPLGIQGDKGWVMKYEMIKCLNSARDENERDATYLFHKTRDLYDKMIDENIDNEQD